MRTSYLAEDNSLLSSQNSVSLVLEASRAASSMLEQDRPAQLLDMEAAQDLDRTPVGCTSITQTGGSHHVQVVFLSMGPENSYDDYKGCNLALTAMLWRSVAIAV